MKNLKYIFAFLFFNAFSGNFQTNFLRVVGLVTKVSDKYYHIGSVGRVTKLSSQENFTIDIIDPTTIIKNWKNGYTAYINKGHAIKIKTPELGINDKLTKDNEL